MMALSTAQRIFAVWLERSYPYFVLCFIPIALLDFRISASTAKFVLSDIYLLGLICVFSLVHPRAYRWYAHCLLPFLPFLAYVFFSALLRYNYLAIYELVQWLLVLLWVPLFVSVFSKVAEAQLRYFIFTMVLATLYTVVMDYCEGRYMHHKFFGNAKYTFSFMFLVVSLWLLQRFSWQNFVLFIIGGLLLVLSWERKSILISLLTLAAIVPLVNFRVSGRVQSLVLVLVQLSCLCSGFIMYYFLVKKPTGVTHYLDAGRGLWESKLYRGNLLGNGIDIFLSKPWLGVGIQQLDDHMATYHLREKLAHYTHNWYLDFFIEYGVIGVITFFIPVVWFMLQLQPKHPRAWLLAPLAAYCLCVPALMANGTTTMLVYCTAVASIIVLGAPGRAETDYSPKWAS